MGCLIFVISDSHKWRSTKDRLSTSFIGSKNPLDDFNKAIKNKIKNFDKEFIEMEVGDVSFHHGDLWHGSGINDSNDERLTLSIHFIKIMQNLKVKLSILGF